MGPHIFVDETKERGRLAVAERLRYDHLRAHEDHLLALPDAIAWSWARGGEWKAMARPMVDEVRPVGH
ncbi:hypothetical protein [Micromonospora sp. RP3T]|uniref:hypothetical protein n=1 Tax=Micromonospora sp. RP3T TaxID=2135446 RepID=UPI003D713ADC